jgi:hypothetical protein
VRFERNVLKGVAALLCAFAAVFAREVPPQKIELIRSAMESMQLDRKIQGMIDHRVEGRVQRLKADNPGLSDSTAAAARAVIRETYAEERQARDGLDARVYAVFDKHLTESDLRFAKNFNASDNGKRYREVAPRIVEECVREGTRWANEVDYAVRRKLQAQPWGMRLKL